MPNPAAIFNPAACGLHAQDLGPQRILPLEHEELRAGRDFIWARDDITNSFDFYNNSKVTQSPERMLWAGCMEQALYDLTAPKPASNAEKLRQDVLSWVTQPEGTFAVACEALELDVVAVREAIVKLANQQEDK